MLAEERQKALEEKKKALEEKQKRDALDAEEKRKAQ